MFRLFDGTMHGPQSLKAFLERLAEPIICLDLAREEGVTAEFRLLEDEKERSARWLLLVRDVRVPLDPGELVVREVLLEAVERLVAVDNVEFGVPRYVARRRVSLYWAKVSFCKPVRADTKKTSIKIYTSRAQSAYLGQYP